MHVLRTHFASVWIVFCCCKVSLVKHPSVRSYMCIGYNRAEEKKRQRHFWVFSVIAIGSLPVSRKKVWQVEILLACFPVHPLSLWNPHGFIESSLSSPQPPWSCSSLSFLTAPQLCLCHFGPLFCFGSRHCGRIWKYILQDRPHHPKHYHNRCHHNNNNHHHHSHSHDYDLAKRTK